jgi:uroporphyrinogen decarboxylase
MLLLKSLSGERIERFPVWLMRQAGRYMPQYRELRAKEKDFLSFCKNVELAVKVSLLPLELLDVDAVIIFSDILVPLEPMGINVRFEEGEGPHLEWDGDVKALRKITSKDTEFVNEIIKEVKRAQDLVPVIGFCGAPWTLFAYAVEGKGKADFKKAKLFMWERRKEYFEFLGLLSENLVEYLKGQVKAGADLVQVFDSWLMHMPYEDLKEYAVLLKAFFERLKGNSECPLYTFTEVLESTWNCLGMCPWMPSLWIGRWICFPGWKRRIEPFRETWTHPFFTAQRMLSSVRFWSF